MVNYIDSSSDGEIDNRREVGGGNDGRGDSRRGQRQSWSVTVTLTSTSAAYYFRDSSSDGGVDFGITWTMMYCESDRNYACYNDSDFDSDNDNDSDYDYDSPIFNTWLLELHCLLRKSVKR